MIVFALTLHLRTNLSSCDIDFWVKSHNCGPQLFALTYCSQCIYKGYCCLVVCLHCEREVGLSDLRIL